MSGSGGLAFVGDVHLDRGDADLEAFLRFLDDRGSDTRHLVLLGDLFNLWIGSGVDELPHQRAVAKALERLRKSGITTAYVEGNRDYRIADRYLGTAFDRVTGTEMAVTWGRHRIAAIHGDLANERDRRYRTWRRISRSGAFWFLFRALPRRRRLAVAEGLEGRMRSTNLAFKGAFPEEGVRRASARVLARGFDTVVFGHFHEEIDLEARSPSPPGRIVVLPEWKGSRRYLATTAEGDLRFADG